MISVFAGVALVSAILSWLAVRRLRPWLLRVALARPNARSSHDVPTPQGGGVAVMGATLAAAGGGLLVASLPIGSLHLAVGAATLPLAAIGFRDDVRPLPAGIRLVVQFACAGLIVALAGERLSFPVGVPAVLAFGLLTLAGVWWINLVNFMDGIDWMTVAQFVPLTAAICLFGLSGNVETTVAIWAAALLGALLGFAPANRPVARLFLGDVGSLPIGLLTGWMLLDLAQGGRVAASLLLAMYYSADATLTLVRRLWRGERITEAHRSHFYQRALDQGWSVLAIDGLVFGLNVALGLLASATLWWPGIAVQLGALALGACLVGATLTALVRPVPAFPSAGRP